MKATIKYWTRSGKWSKAKNIIEHDLNKLASKISKFISAKKNKNYTDFCGHIYDNGKQIYSINSTGDFLTNEIDLTKISL